MFKTYILIFVILLILSSCDWGRIHSKERFEKNCHVNIPQGISIIKDEYNGSINDYTIYYELTFTTSTFKNFINSIKSSDYYYKYWSKSPRGYNFYKKVGNRNFTEYKIKLDTTNRIASFEEDAN